MLVQRKDFEDAIKELKKIVEKNATLPILACVKMTFLENGNLELVGTDLENALVLYVPFESDGIKLNSGVFPIQNVHNFLKAIPKPPRPKFQKYDNNTVSIWIEEHNLHIGKYTITNGLAIDEFPEIPDVKETNHSIENLPKKLKKVIKAVSTDDPSRPALENVYFDLKQGRIAGTDGHRLHITTIPANGTESFILPKKAASFLTTCTTLTGRYGIQNQMVKFELENGFLVTKIIDERYPEYARVFPKEGDEIGVLSINKRKFIESLIGAQIVSTHNVKLHLDNAVKISAENFEIGKYEDTLQKARWTGDILEICFDPKYLVETIKEVENDNVHIQFYGSLKPAVIREEDFQALVMPRRID